MTTDIYPRIAINLVIFTVVEQKRLAGLADLGLVQQPPQHVEGASGYALLVLTINGEGGRCLPGGELRNNETIERAAKRIADEQLGLSIRTRLRALEPFDNPERNLGTREIAFPYWGMVEFDAVSSFLGGRDRVGLQLVSSRLTLELWAMQHRIEDYDGVSLFGNRLMPDAKRGISHKKSLSRDLGTKHLALDHDDMVFYAWRQLRHAFNSKLDPFRFLGCNPIGTRFRMSELQEFYEVCRGEFLQRDTFRRLMTSENSYVRRSGGTDRERPGKPAILYSLEAPPSPEQ